MKDNFSSNAEAYAAYRPAYPGELFVYIQNLVKNKLNAWDCGTGNGQVASELAGFFEQVFATDISAAQLENAIIKSNVHYGLGKAEETNFPDDFFNLITVAQAIHWFDFDLFYKEVRRTATKHAILVVLGYGKCSINAEVDIIIDHLYSEIVGPYWDKERRYIDEAYLTIPFPFEEVIPPKFEIQYEWTLQHFIGYLSTWSAVKHHDKKEMVKALSLIEAELKQAWGEVEKRTVTFPVLLRIGRVKGK